MTQTIEQFIASAGLTMTTWPADANPALEDEKWAASANHWLCTICAGRSRMSLVYSMGKGLGGRPPELSDVLDCLASDGGGLTLPKAAGVEEEAFAEWCGEYGYDTDSRKALCTYRACLIQMRRLRDLLGESAYNTLLSDVERL